ncbi:hypothetical protein GWI33_006416 [Rhynchophorus ferrugineus]|uniref:Uncharacterized protein n=1 Tax=Rhynchophorus ferrugineus TaxID=354439 RepID=A0A834IFX2_RHYFE|nr:hypothetical protein GWI33_006416 [Rhynchophorus ferrugineus]
MAKLINDIVRYADPYCQQGPSQSQAPFDTRSFCEWIFQVATRDHNSRSGINYGPPPVIVPPNICWKEKEERIEPPSTIHHRRTVRPTRDLPP